ncbi:unnamed protein product [Cochlearia groenlandica]
MVWHETLPHVRVYVRLLWPMCVGRRKAYGSGSKGSTLFLGAPVFVSWVDMADSLHSRATNKAFSFDDAHSF